jgi:hypothetical protein
MTNSEGEIMKRKTVIAFAVASAFAWPFASNAHDSARTPLSVNESSDSQMQHDRFISEYSDSADNGSWEVGTPLSVNETAPAAKWSGFDRWAMPKSSDRYSTIERSDRAVMTAPSDNEVASSTEGGLTMNDSFADRSSEDLALADQGRYDGYLVEVPSRTDYYIVETPPPSESYDVVLIPQD